MEFFVLLSVMTHSRQLAAIMFTDIVGYTALMGKDVEAGLMLLRKSRTIQKPLIEKYGGKWLKEMGDGVLAQFSSAVDSVLCAIEIQKKAREELDAKIRIGIHLGDVTLEHEDVFGDGVNIASRVQSIADPGGIYVTESIHDAIRSRIDLKSNLLGKVQLKNVDHLNKIYFMEADGLPIPSKSKRKELFKEQMNTARRKVYAYILAVIIVLVSVGGWWIYNKSENVMSSLAVLTVENLSDNIEPDWLEVAIHNGLIDAIGKIQLIQVPPRRTVLRLLEKDLSLPEIAKELNVDEIVEASYSKTDNNLNIQVRLFQVEPEVRQVWSQGYEKRLKNITSIYNEVAKTIAQNSDIILSDYEMASLSTVNEIDPEALKAYTNGQTYMENLSEENLNKAFGYFEKALSIEPNYVLAHIGISGVWGSRLQQGYMSFEEAYPKSKEAANKAIELDSTRVEVRSKLAAMYTWREWDWKKAGVEFERVFRMKPNGPRALTIYSHYLSYMGRAEEGLTYGEKAIKLDPLNTFNQSFHAMALKNAKKYDEALGFINNILKSTPDDRLALPALWAIYHEKEMFDEALETAIDNYTFKDEMEAVEVLEKGNKEGGYRLAMQRTAEMMIKRKENLGKFVPAGQIVTLYARAQMKDEAIEWLNIAYDEHDANMPYISVDPLFDFLRDDARFKELMNKMNFPK